MGELQVYLLSALDVWAYVGCLCSVGGVDGSQEISGPTLGRFRYGEGRRTGGAAGPVPGERGALAEPLPGTG